MSITLDKFIKEWDGKYCEIAGSPGAENQCVDICNQYLRDVLNLPIIQWTNAKNFLLIPILKKHFKSIKNTQKAINYINKEYKRERVWVVGGYSKEGIRNELERYIPGKPTTGLWYKFVDVMMGVEAKTTPFVFYKVKLDRAVKGLRRDKKKLVKRDIQHPVHEQVNEFITTLELIGECVAGLKDYREEMRYIADRDRVQRIEVYSY